MKPLNLQSLLQAKDSLSEDIFKSFLCHYGIEIKTAELADLAVLADHMMDTNAQCIERFSMFYVGYRIPQIGKEFDLLRFGKESIINIELKNNSTTEKIKKQLCKNKYYLNFTTKKIHAFTFVSSTSKLYRLNDDGDIEVISLDCLLQIIDEQVINYISTPDILFNPSDYLISPFNSTDKFLNGEYFLTHQQEDVKTQIIESITSQKISRFIAITGSAGTGKTLLTYDIAWHLMEKKHGVLIAHCGQLNDGHVQLRENGWKIISIKDYKEHDLANFDLLIIDETQRIYPIQLKYIVERVSSGKCGCLFSYDNSQTLSNWEEKNNISSEISSIASITSYKLTEKIRTNKEIASFIKMLFNNRSSASLSNTNIEINFFKNEKAAKNYLGILNKSKWEVLRFTPSQRSEEHHTKYSDTFNKTSHAVIGQEFDGVVVAIDKFFTYDKNGNLTYSGNTYYAATKMLFQNITRARKKLNLVIIDNEEILKRCMAILQ